jgi:glutamine phosphoribosylpyrophosphate amidotransferase
MGLVHQVFSEQNLQPLKGHLAIGQTRYLTTGSSNLRNAQPYLIETIFGPLGVAHNGNLTNAYHLRRQLLKRGVGLSSTSDSEVITQMLAAPADVWAQPLENGHEPDRWVARLRAFMEVAQGAYSLAILTRGAVYAVRDPYSAIPAAIGYSNASGISYTEGLTKNRYIGRTFIEPDDQLRKEGVRIKYNTLDANLMGKRVILIDDSIIRGNTADPLVLLVRDGGAKEVHMRVSSPPVRFPCFMGIDMATKKELIAHRLDVEGIRRRIGADSLSYLSLEGMIAAVSSTIKQQTGHCTACFSGDYPIPIPEWLFEDYRDQEKLIFEKTWG